MRRLPSTCRLLLAGGMFVILTLGLQAQLNRAESDVDETQLALEERGMPTIRTFLPREYGGHNQIWKAVEAPNGLMYFGAHSLVLEFDGITWRKIAVPGAAFIRGLAIDAAGQLWAGGVNEFGGFEPDADGRLVFKSLRPQMPAPMDQVGDIRTVYAMRDGVYFQTDSYLMRWNGEQLKVWTMDEKYIVLAVAWGDRIVVCRDNSWTMPTEDGGWEQVSWEPKPLGRSFLSGMVADGNGGWWCAAQREGLLHFDGERTEFMSGAIADHIRDSRLSGISRFPSGRLVFTSYGRGLLITDPELNPLVHLQDHNGLPSNTVICSFVSRAGILWVGTENGIARIDFPPGLGRFNPNFGLARNGVDSVARIDGKIVLATNEGAFVLKPGEGAVANPGIESWATIEDNLNTLLAVDDGVLIGSLSGLWWVRDGKVELLESPSNIRYLTSYSRMPDRIVALHLSGIAIWRREGDGWVYQQSLEQPRGEFGGLSEDSEGDLWVGTNNDGYWRLPYKDIELPTDPSLPFPDPTPIHYNEDRGIPTYRDRATMHTIDGAPLFATGKGFFRYDPATDSFSPEPSYDPRFTDGTWTAHYLASSPTGGVWIEARALLSTADNFAQIIGKSLNGTFTPLPLPNLSEIGALDELVCELVDGDEILWVCGRNALLRINVTDYLATPKPPVGRTLLHSVVTSAGKVIATHRSIDAPDAAPVRVRPGDNSLRFYFGTPGLAGEPEAKHTSQLIGFVDGGEEPNNSGERTFTNLPPGRYIFQASGRTDDQRSSEPTLFEFEVLAPWWATSAAKAAYLFAAVIAVYLIVRWRTRRLVRQRAALEQIVAERTAELANKAKALERLHQLEHDETLAARLAAETVRLELLRYQLNPHFLFNSLNSIRALVHTAPASASEMVSKLAEFCRRTLNRGNDEMVTVADEVGMARAYLEIEQVRWQDGLRIKIDVQASTYDCAIPQNLLLPLLENAIKYGGRTSPDLLEVHLSIRRDDIALICEVSNTGSWVEPSANPFTDSTQIGLQNLRQRIFQHYGANASVAQSIKTGWVIITVRLPVKTSPPPSA